MRRWLPLIALLVLFAAFRYAGLEFDGWMQNFSPLPAFTFCAVAFLPRGQRLAGLVICLIAWAVAYPLVNHYLGYDWTIGLVATLLGIAAVIAVALLWRRARSVWQKLLGISLGALAFYLVTNTFSFFTLPDYQKTLTGFIEAQWTGAPHHAQPTWVFLRNLIGSGLLFGSLFFAANALPAGQEDDEEEVEPEEDPVEA